MEHHSTTASSPGHDAEGGLVPARVGVVGAGNRSVPDQHAMIPGVDRGMTIRRNA